MTEWIEKLREWLETPAARFATRLFRILFFVAVLGWLVLKVRAIGWRQVLDALPTNPLFYILFLFMFLALPASETVIFRIILGGRILREFPVFIRKRVFNSALLGYSGEVYYFLWAQKHLGVPAKKILLGIKDNAILSALASAGVTSALLVAFLLSGRASSVARWLDSATGGLIAGALILAFVIPVAIRLRRQIISIAPRVALTVFGIHVVRICLVVLLQATQWAVVLPQEPWTVWLIFLTTQMVVSRLPFVPNRDLLFLSAGLEMSNVIEGPREAMAGLLLAGGALTQGSNLIFFLLTSIKRRSGTPDAEAEAEAGALDADEEIGPRPAR
ncbi:hypothetical protein [Stakelama marina]|uniref:Uncharacterized protein n=1 Tax=Stakelama marina TaxID=2826939 RepID=A0A8T4ICE0_9SPHN|nr:hypothetical protein [Stakelama marina]MBR0552307.1 hypothetical protein [Stakelama marina]